MTYTYSKTTVMRPLSNLDQIADRARRHSVTRWQQCFGENGGRPQTFREWAGIVPDDRPEREKRQEVLEEIRRRK